MDVIYVHSSQAFGTASPKIPAPGLGHFVLRGRMLWWVRTWLGGGLTRCWLWARYCLEAGIKLLSISTSDPQEGMEGTCSPGWGSSGAWPWALLGSERSWGHLCAQAAMRATGACDGVSRTWPKSQGRAGTVPSAWCLLDSVWVLPPVCVPHREDISANWKDFSGE